MIGLAIEILVLGLAIRYFAGDQYRDWMQILGWMAASSIPVIAIILLAVFVYEGPAEVKIAFGLIGLLCHFAILYYFLRRNLGPEIAIKILGVYSISVVLTSLIF